jgi:hypothetical protein
MLASTKSRRAQTIVVYMNIVRVEKCVHHAWSSGRRIQETRLANMLAATKKRNLTLGSVVEGFKSRTPSSKKSSHVKI